MSTSVPPAGPTTGPSTPAASSPPRANDRQPSANDYQIGGSHYRQDGTHEQHWDRLVRLYGIDVAFVYFVGNATAYLERYRDKNGVDDLRKAAHYVQKLIELEEAAERERTVDPKAIDMLLKGGPVDGYDDQGRIINTLRTNLPTDPLGCKGLLPGKTTCGCDPNGRCPNRNTTLPSTESAPDVGECVHDYDQFYRTVVRNGELASEWVEVCVKCFHAKPKESR